jgi:hypothetical protein
MTTDKTYIDQTVIQKLLIECKYQISMERMCIHG